MNEGQLWMTIGADNTQFDKTARDTNRKLNEMSQNVKAFSQGITSSFVEAAKSMAGFYAVAKAGTVFQDLIEKNDQFNKSMKEVSTLSDEVANNLDSYKQKILELTTQIPIGADEAAKALYQINSAGHTGAEGMAVLEASAKAAIGGVTDTATAADTITTVLNAYKMSASEAASVSDKLFTAVKLGKTTMGELGASIAQVAPVAASFGVSIDQVLGAVATLTKNGTPTVQAMTQIRAAIVALSDSLGATYFQTHTLQEGMKEIREQYPDNNKLKETLGRVEGFNAVLAMTGENASGAAEDLDKLTKSAGAAADAYSRMSGGKGNELTKLQNNIMKEMTSLNDTVSEVVTNVAKKLNEAFDSGAIEGYIDVIKELVVVYGAYKAVAIAVAAVKAANTMITETAETAMYEAQAAELRKVIALKQTQAAVSGETAAAEGAELTARQAELAALQKEAAEVAKLLKEKAAEAAANLANAKSEQAMAQARLSSAQTGVAMREQELAAAIASGDALKVETAEIELQKAALEENAAARRLATANKEVDIAASTADTTAKAAETAATGMDTAATTGDAVATGFLTKAKIALSSAVNKVTAAMAANPFTVALVAVVALGYAVYKLAQYHDSLVEKSKGATAGLDKFGRSAEDAKKATEELNDAYTKTNAGIKESIARLQAFKGSKEEEKKLVKELNDKYGEAMGYYNSVNEWYKALTKNSAKYCQQMTNEVRLRQLATQAAENEQKIHDILYNEDGTKKTYSTEKHTAREQLLGGSSASDLDIANQDLKNLRQANKQIQKQMQAIFNENAKIENQINGGGSGTGGNKPTQKNDKAYWQKQVDDVDKAIAELDTKDVEFAKKKSALDKQKKVYEAQLRKFDDPDKGQSARDKTKEKLQKQLDARKELNQELLEMQAKNNDDQIALMEEGHNKRMREISNEYSKEQNEISKTALQWAKQNREAGLKGDQTKGSIQIAGAVYGGLTDEQQTALDEAIKNAQDKMEKSTQELLQSDIQYMREYLKEYGTFQQQRYAIAQEYDEKIAKLKAGGASEYELKIAERQKQKAISDNYETDLLSRIDFATAFDKFGTSFKEPLEQLRDELKNYINSASFKGKKVEEQRAIIEALNNVENRLGGSLKGLNFAKVGRDTDAYNKAMKDHNAAIVKQEVALEELARAEKEYEKALKKGQEAEIDSAKEKVEGAKMAADSAAAQVQSTQQIVNDAQNTLNESDRKLMESMQSIQNLAQGLSSGSASSLWNSIPTEIKNKAAAAISKALGGKSDLWSQIIGLILSILDTLKDGIGNLLQAIIQSIGDAVEGLLTEIGSGKTFARIGEAIYSLITSIIKGIGNLFSGGTFSNINWSGGNADKVNKITEENTRAIENNTRRIEALKDVIDKSSGVQAVQAGQAAIEAQKEINKDAMNTLMEQMGYHSAHHSNEYYLDNKTLAEKYAKERIKAEKASGVNLGDVKELSDIYDMTPEQLKVIRDYMPETWRYLTEVGKYDKSEYWEAVVDQAGKLEDITEKVKENITQWSLDGVKDEFRSMLMDWDNDVMDFSENFAKHMTEAIIKIKMGEGGENSLEKRIEKWYDDYYDKLAGGNFSEDDQKQAMQDYQDLVNEGLKIRDTAYKLTGYSDILNQKATAKGIESITADQADQLIGRITAIQIAVEADKSTIQGTLTQLIMISSLTTQGNAYLSDILSQHAIGNSYLEDIAKYSKAMSLELDGKMQKIVDGLNRL